MLKTSPLFSSTKKSCLQFLSLHGCSDENADDDDDDDDDGEQGKDFRYTWPNSVNNLYA